MNRKHLTALLGWFFAISLLLVATSGPVCAIDLTYSSFFPATHANSVLAQQWCDEVAREPMARSRSICFPAVPLRLLTNAMMAL